VSNGAPRKGSSGKGGSGRCTLTLASYRK